jgi:hypothetical protein
VISHLEENGGLAACISSSLKCVTWQVQGASSSAIEAVQEYDLLMALLIEVLG